MSKSAVVPSRMNLNIFKGKIQAAKKGHELLKKKCDALKTKFRTIMIALLDTKKTMGSDADTAYLSYATATYGAGEFSNIVKDSIKRATVRLDLNSENIAGTQLPSFIIKETEDAESNLNQIGIARGGQEIQRCKEKFRDLLAVLVKIASLQTSFMTLDEVIKITNRRVNALEYIVIPRLLAIVEYIKQELDELSREDYFRLKKVLDNKKKIVEEEKRDTEKRAAEMAKNESLVRGGDDQIGENEDEEDDSQLLNI